HTENPAVLVLQRHNDLGPGGVKCRQITSILVHIANDDGFARFQGGAAQALRNREAWIRRRLFSGTGNDDEFVFNDFVNAHPAIVPRRADHLRCLLDALPGAATGQNKASYLLQLLAGFVLHRRAPNLVENKTSASAISTFV